MLLASRSAAIGAFQSGPERPAARGVGVARVVGTLTFAARNRYTAAPKP